MKTIDLLLKLEQDLETARADLLIYQPTKAEERAELTCIEGHTVWSGLASEAKNHMGTECCYCDDWWDGDDEYRELTVREVRGTDEESALNNRVGRIEGQLYELVRANQHHILEVLRQARDHTEDLFTLKSDRVTNEFLVAVQNLDKEVENG